VDVFTFAAQCFLFLSHDINCTYDSTVEPTEMLKWWLLFEKYCEIFLRYSPINVVQHSLLVKLIFSHPSSPKISIITSTQSVYN